MTSFAVAADLATRLGLTFTEDETTRATALLDSASKLIRAAAKQTIAVVEDDELTLAGTNDERLLLPERPVVSVASVTINDFEFVEGTHWYLDKNSIVRMPMPLRGDPLQLDAPFLLGGNRRGFGWPTQELVIVYTHGYEDTSDEYGLAHSIALEACVRVWVNPGSLIQEREGNTEATYAPYAAPPRGLLLTKDEKRDLARTFGRVALRSIPIAG